MRQDIVQFTVDRFEGVCPPGNFWVVTNASYVVINPVEFRRVIGNALKHTKDSDAILTIGIKPSRPETGYGYVETSETVAGEICGVKEFKEKPDLVTAKDYLAKGNYLWNAGIFVWNVKTIVDSITKYKPGIAKDMDNIQISGDVETIFPHCEKISIDFAVMEPASIEGKVFTHPADFGWSDLGNWASLHDKLKKDENGNASVGNVSFYECADCVVHTEDSNKVVLQGLDGYIVSEKNGQILVCKSSEEQKIKYFSQL